MLGVFLAIKGSKNNPVQECLHEVMDSKVAGVFIDSFPYEVVLRGPVARLLKRSVGAHNSQIIV